MSHPLRVCSLLDPDSDKSCIHYIFSRRVVWKFNSSVVTFIIPGCLHVVQWATFLIVIKLSSFSNAVPSGQD